MKSCCVILTILLRCLVDLRPVRSGSSRDSVAGSRRPGCAKVRRAQSGDIEDVPGAPAKILSARLINVTEGEFTNGEFPNTLAMMSAPAKASRPDCLLQFRLLPLSTL